ncbi:MAG: proline dehydrogenase family protein [Longimicrobiales bacterium]
MLRDVLIYLSENNAARKFSMHAPGARAMARRFVAGETVDDGINAAKALATAGFGISLDCLGESVKSREEASHAGDTYVELLERIATEMLPDGTPLRDSTNVSLKLTQMGQDIRSDHAHDDQSSPSAPWPRPDNWPIIDRGGYDEAFLRANLGRVLDVAKRHGIFVRFDMESSLYTQRTLDFFQSLWNAGTNNIGVVLQSYLTRTAHDVNSANLQSVRVRICKGAYKEPEPVAYQEKSRVDSNYVQVMQTLLSDGNYPGIATHDEAMIQATKDWAKAKSIPTSAYEFQMLYGVRRDLQNQLLREGDRVRIYVPFGEAWYAYLMRRMAERPANLFFIVNAVLIESPFGGLMGKGKHK